MNYFRQIRRGQCAPPSQLPATLAWQKSQWHHSCTCTSKILEMLYTGNDLQTWWAHKRIFDHRCSFTLPQSALLKGGLSAPIERFCAGVRTPILLHPFGLQSECGSQLKWHKRRLNWTAATPPDRIWSIHAQTNMIQSTRKALFVGICLCHGSGIRSPESNSRLKQQKKQQKNTRNMPVSARVHVQ